MSRAGATREGQGAATSAPLAASAEPEGVPALLVADARFSWSPSRRGGSQTADAFTLHVSRLSLETGTRTLLVGPSGSGKSTLLGLVCGTLTARSGEVRVLGTDLAKLSGSRRDRFRAEHTGIVFQMFNLVPYLGLVDNVTLPLRFAPERRARVEAAGGPRAEALRLLARLGLDGAAIDRPVTQLSVGQQQRVAVARALIGAPALVVADEPTSALDRDHQDAFLDLLFAEVEAAGSTLLMVSHETRFASRFDCTLDLGDILAGRQGGDGVDGVDGVVGSVDGRAAGSETP